MQFLMVHIIIYSVYISEKRSVRHNVFLHSQKLSFRSDLQPRISPPVSIDHKRIPRIFQRILYLHLSLLQYVLHLFLLVDLNQKFLHVMLVAPNSA